MYNFFTIVIQMGIMTLVACQTNGKWFEKRRGLLLEAMIIGYAIVNELEFVEISEIVHYIFFAFCMELVYWKISMLWIAYISLLAHAILIYVQAICINWFSVVWIAEDYDRAGFFINLCVALIIFLIDRIIKWRKIDVNYVHKSIVGRIVLSATSVGILLFCMCFKPILEEQYYIQTQAILLLIGIVLIVVILVFFESSQIKYHKLVESLQRQIRVYEEEKKENQLKQHEFKKELQVIQLMSKGNISLLYNKIEQEKQEILYQELQPILRDILRSYTEIFEQEGIKLKLEATGLVPYFDIEDSDMISIVGNLIENAVEAVKELPKEERWIKLKLGEEDGQKWLCMSNPYNQMIEIDNNLMKRGVSVKGLNRGVGLYIVNRIVKKHDGKVKIIRDKEFYIRIDFSKII